MHLLNCCLIRYLWNVFVYNLADRCHRLTAVCQLVEYTSSGPVSSEKCSPMQISLESTVSLPLQIPWEFAGFSPYPWGHSTRIFIDCHSFPRSYNEISFNIFVPCGDPMGLVVGPIGYGPMRSEIANVHGKPWRCPWEYHGFRKTVGYFVKWFHYVPLAVIIISR